MALSKEDQVKLKSRFKLAKKKPLRFYYCQEGPEGDPVLAIEKQINSEKKRIRAQAVKKIFVEGEVKLVGKGMAFITPTPKKGKFAVNIKRFFGKKVPEMLKARILTPEELETELAASGEAADGSKEAAPSNPAMAKLKTSFKADPRTMADADLKALGTIVFARLEAGDESVSGLAKRVKKEARLRKRIRSAAKEVYQSQKVYKTLTGEGTAAMLETKGKPKEIIDKWAVHIQAITSARDGLVEKSAALREALAAQA